MVSPHGGRLVDRVLEAEARQKGEERARNLTKIELPFELQQEVFNIATGVFSPLEGFLGRDDFISVLNEKRLTSDLPWTIPIVLDVRRDFAGPLDPGEEIALTDESGRVLALMEVEEKYDYDKGEFARKIFGTDDDSHPGVARVKGLNEILLGGKINLINFPEFPFSRYALKPLETRILFKEKGWHDVVGFQTRNVPHLGHEYVQKTALTFVDGVFINPVIGRKKKGDFKDEVILETYEGLIKHYYLKERAVMAILYTQMRYAGPREAILHAIARKNFGCTHFVVGRDHAGVGKFYDPFAAHEIFDEFPDLGITPIFFKSFLYCKRCGGVVNEKTCPHGESDQVSFSGTRIRELLNSGAIPPPELMRPEVAEIIRKHKRPFVE